MNLTINIQAPELAHAIETLAIAIGCTVDKIGVGEAIKEAVDQGSTKETEEPETTPDADMVENEDPPFEIKPITIEQVREAFVAKNSKANAPKLKAILKKYKVAKVTDLPEENFEDVLKKLEEI
jgi:hypothetical protein